jgi:hypothetical protein
LRLAFLVLLLIPVAGISQSYSDYSERGIDALTEQDYDRAIAIYDSLFLKFKPKNADLYNASCAYSRAGRHREAVEFLRQAFRNGYTGFDWMYYDVDLNPIRHEPAYIALEKEYRPDSVVFFFEILRQLSASDDVSLCDSRISIADAISDYSINDIMYRVGSTLNLTPDSLIDFSGKTLEICRSRFVDQDNAYNSLQRIALAQLTIYDCRGSLELKKIRAQKLILDATAEGRNKLQALTLDEVKVNGIARLEATGIDFVCNNSSFSINVPGKDSYRWGLTWDVNCDRVQIKNTTFSNSQKDGPLYPFDFSFQNLKSLIIYRSKFYHMTRLLGSVEDRLVIDENSFPPFVEINGLNIPDFDFYFPFSQLRTSKLVLFDYRNNSFKIRGDSIAHYSDEVLFDEFTGLYKRLYDHYRSRADISSANEVYVLMKELEIDHLKALPHRTSEETIRLRLNQLMGLYTDHATSPGKALIISFYIILVFGIFYCFFPSDWDKTSKGQIIIDFRLFIEKNEHGYVKPFLRMMKGLMISLLNAVALSLNAFITLGFGNIPTSGVARYMCVLQGALGWFLLSLFTVALLNQVLL